MGGWGTEAQPEICISTGIRRFEASVLHPTMDNKCTCIRSQNNCYSPMLNTRVNQQFQQLTTRPEKDYFRCLYFPVEEPTPKFVWLQIGHVEEALPPEAKELLGGKDVEATVYDHDAGLDLDLDYHVTVYHCRNYHLSGLPVRVSAR